MVRSQTDSAPVIPIVAASSQFILGAAASFYLFAITFTHPFTMDNLAIPVGIAIAGSLVSSALWGCSRSVPVWLSPCSYSLAFWGWTLFVSQTNVGWEGLVWWGGLAACTNLCGLASSCAVRMWCKRYRWHEEGPDDCSNCGYPLNVRSVLVRCPECGQVPARSNRDDHAGIS